MARQTTSAALLAALRHARSRVSPDDFGTGYSSPMSAEAALAFGHACKTHEPLRAAIA